MTDQRMGGVNGRGVSTLTLDIDTKRVECIQFLNPLRLKGQFVIGVILARSVDGHDKDIFCSMFG